MQNHFKNHSTTFRLCILPIILATDGKIKICCYSCLKFEMRKIIFRFFALLPFAFWRLAFFRIYRRSATEVATICLTSFLVCEGRQIRRQGAYPVAMATSGLAASISSATGNCNQSSCFCSNHPWRLCRVFSIWAIRSTCSFFFFFFPYQINLSYFFVLKWNCFLLFG